MDQIKNSMVPGKVMILYGARQVGKTTLVKQLMDSLVTKTRYINADELVYRELLASQDRHRLQEAAADAELLIIDEAQRIPDIGINLKIMVDSFPDLKIIATGSASLELANRISEPLTGRKLTYFLYPLSYQELSDFYGNLETRSQLERWLIWGGYPAIVTEVDRPTRERLLLELVDSYLYRDLLELEDIRHASKIVNLLRLLAFQIGSEVSLNELAANLALNFQTVQRYLDLLEKGFVIFRLEGFSRNLRKEISKSCRYFFYDNGVRNTLIQNFNPAPLRNDMGQLWENYLQVERRKALQAAGQHANMYFWRTYDQKEIDYIEENRGQLNGYEFGLQKTAIRRPTRETFLNSYPGAKISPINQENFEDFIIGRSDR